MVQQFFQRTVMTSRESDELAAMPRPSLPSATPWREPEGELAVDLFVTDAAVVVRAPLAGVALEDLTIAVHNDLLTLRGERRDESSFSPDETVAQECHWGPFSRTVVLPVPVLTSEAEAVLRNGIVTVTIPRPRTSAVAIREIRS